MNQPQTVKSYKTLIRVQKNEANALRRELIPLWKKEELLLKKMERLDNELEKERIKTNHLNDPLLYHFFLNYRKKNRQIYNLTSQAIQQIQIEMHHIQKKIELLFEKQKQYEIALENKEKALLEKEKKNENNFFDEIAAKNTKKTSFFTK